MVGGWTRAGPVPVGQGGNAGTGRRCPLSSIGATISPTTASRERRRPHEVARRPSRPRRRQTARHRTGNRHREAKGRGEGEAAAGRRPPPARRRQRGAAGIPVAAAAHTDSELRVDIDEAVVADATGAPLPAPRRVVAVRPHHEGREARGGCRRAPGAGIRSRRSALRRRGRRRARGHDGERRRAAADGEAQRATRRTAGGEGRRRAVRLCSDRSKSHALGCGHAARTCVLERMAGDEVTNGGRPLQERRGHASGDVSLSTLSAVRQYSCSLEALSSAAAASGRRSKR